MYTADDPKIGTGRRQMITVRNLAGRIARTLFVTVPDEATQFLWLSLEPSFEFDDDPRWLRFVRRVTWLLAWITGLASFVLMPLAIYTIAAHSAYGMGLFCAYSGGVGSFGFFMALRGIAHDRNRQHIALSPEELSNEAVRSLRTAKAPPEAIALNDLMD